MVSLLIGLRTSGIAIGKECLGFKIYVKQRTVSKYVVNTTLKSNSVIHTTLLSVIWLFPMLGLGRCL